MGILSALRSGVAAATTITAHLSGDEAALGRYSAEVGERFKTYLVERSAVYATERRWWELPFWKRRRGLAAASRHLGSIAETDAHPFADRGRPK
jgi:hypothetical protein